MRQRLGSPFASGGREYESWSVEVQSSRVIFGHRRIVGECGCHILNNELAPASLRLFARYQKQANSRLVGDFCISLFRIIFIEQNADPPCCETGEYGDRVQCADGKQNSDGTGCRRALNPRCQPIYSPPERCKRDVAASFIVERSLIRLTLGNRFQNFYYRRSDGGVYESAEGIVLRTPKIRGYVGCADPPI